MKRSRLFILGSLITSALSLSGCFLDFQEEENIVVNPVSIQVVSTLNLNLQGNNQKVIFPSLVNSTAKNPTFTYVSSNTGVATVDANGVVIGVSVGKCNITVTYADNKNVKANVEVTVIDEAVDHYDYTIMFYMCAADLEYKSEKAKDNEQWFFTQDIQEILGVKNLPDSVRIVIETGGTKKWKMPSSYLEDKNGNSVSKISSNALQRWEVNNSNHKLTLIETLDTNYMASEESFSDFLSWGLDNYEAEQMGVVISGHGGGIAGCAYDDNYTYTYGKEQYPNTLQTYEVASAAKTALANSDKDKFTWIGYDCCLMQCADIASINSDYFDYMVASQELEDAIGWNHSDYLPYLVSDSTIPPNEFLPKICDALLAENHSSRETSRDACLQTLSVLDLSKVDTLVSAFEEVVPQLGKSVNAYKKAKSAFEASYNDFGEGLYGLCDFNSLLKSFTSKYSIDTTAAQEAVNDLVLYTKYCSFYSTKPCGVNAFFPDAVGPDKDDYGLQVGREDYDNKNSTKFSKWQSLCLVGNDFGW